MCICVQCGHFLLFFFAFGLIHLVVDFAIVVVVVVVVVCVRFIHNIQGTPTACLF